VDADVEGGALFVSGINQCFIRIMHLVKNISLVYCDLRKGTYSVTVFRACGTASSRCDDMRTKVR
jgi:hypothetical protein